jgi:hypothetical protein
VRVTAITCGDRVLWSDQSGVHCREASAGVKLAITKNFFFRDDELKRIRQAESVLKISGS